MTAQAFEAQFQQLAEDGSQDELSAALLVNWVLDPTIDADSLRHRIDELASVCSVGIDFCFDGTSKTSRGTHW